MHAFQNIFASLSVFALIFYDPQTALAEKRPKSVFLENKTIKVLAPEYFCPYACTAGERLEGSTVDIARAILEPLGYKIKYSNLNYDRTLQLVKSGEYHATPSSFFVEAKDFTFPTEASSQTQYCVFGNVSAKWTYSKPSDLVAEDRTIGIISALSYGSEIDELVKKFPKNFMVMFGDLALDKQNKMVNSERITALMEDKNSIEWQMARGKLLNMKNLGCTPKTDDLKSYFAISPALANGKEIAQQFSTGMKRLRSSGKLSEILKRYNMEVWPSSGPSFPASATDPSVTQTAAPSKEGKKGEIKATP
jgi:polar amino acid transport system substrate-binding protein